MPLQKYISLFRVQRIVRLNWIRNDFYTRSLTTFIISVLWVAKLPLNCRHLFILSISLVFFSFFLLSFYLAKQQNYNLNSRITFFDTDGHGPVVCTGKTCSTAKFTQKRFARELRFKLLSNLCEKTVFRENISLLFNYILFCLFGRTQ